MLPQYRAPGWRTDDDITDAIRRARLVVVDAQEVRLASLECRHTAAVLRDEAQHLLTTGRSRRSNLPQI